MTNPIERLRAADPAAGERQPDDRAEHDLSVLLAEAPAPARPAPPAAPRRAVPLLVTVAVAMLLVAATAAVLGIVHPRTDVGGTPTIAPTPGSAACRPAEVLPFQCGTYRSTYGGKAVTGDLGGPAKDRLRISFTPEDGALLLTASTSTCFAETVLVRYDGKRLIRIGSPEYAANGCRGRGAERKSWAYAFLNGPLEITGVDGPYFGTEDSSVFFEYLGAAPIGEKQLPRTDSTCIPQHVEPFSCGTYRSIGGTGTLSFLGSDPFTLEFQHMNAQLTANLFGACNGLSAALQPDGPTVVGRDDTVVATGGGATGMLCMGTRGTNDGKVQQLFAGVLTYRIDGDTLVFTKGSSSATFRR